MTHNPPKMAVSVSTTDIIFGLIVAACVGMFTWSALFPTIYGGVSYVLPSFIAFVAGAFLPLASAYAAGTMSTIGLAVSR